MLPVTSMLSVPSQPTSSATRQTTFPGNSLNQPQFGTSHHREIIESEGKHHIKKMKMEGGLPWEYDVIFSSWNLRRKLINKYYKLPTQTARFDFLTQEFIGSRDRKTIITALKEMPLLTGVDFRCHLHWFIEALSTRGDNQIYWAADDYGEALLRNKYPNASPRMKELVELMLLTRPRVGTITTATYSHDNGFVTTKGRLTSDIDEGDLATYIDVCREARNLVKNYSNAVETHRKA